MNCYVFSLKKLSVENAYFLSIEFYKLFSSMFDALLLELCLDLSDILSPSIFLEELSCISDPVSL